MKGEQVVRFAASHCPHVTIADMTVIARPAKS
jgi:hypothetical protein